MVDQGTSLKLTTKSKHYEIKNSAAIARGLPIHRPESFRYKSKETLGISVEPGKFNSKTEQANNSADDIALIELIGAYRIETQRAVRRLKSEHNRSSFALKKEIIDTI